MRLFIIISFIVLFLLSSCSSYTYFYSVMEGADPYIVQNERNEFVIETDSVDVYYNFHGRNAPITVGVHNKMSTAVYVDWRKSGIVIDGNVSTFREPLEEYAQWGDTSVVNYGRFLSDPDGMTTIKSKQRKNTQVLELTNFKFHHIPDSLFVNNTSDWLDGGKSELKSIVYGADDSPIYIGTFLTIYRQANDVDDTLIFDADFYMSELIQGKKKKPSSLRAYKNKSGDVFYSERRKGTFWKKAGNTSLKVLGGAAVVTGNIILWSLGDNLNE